MRWRQVLQFAVFGVFIERRKTYHAVVFRQVMSYGCIVCLITRMLQPGEAVSDNHLRELQGIQNVKDGIRGPYLKCVVHHHIPPACLDKMTVAFYFTKHAISKIPPRLESMNLNALDLAGSPLVMPRCGNMDLMSSLSEFL